MNKILWNKSTLNANFIHLSSFNFQFVSGLSHKISFIFKKKEKKSFNHHLIIQILIQGKKRLSEQ